MGASVEIRQLSKRFQKGGQVIEVLRDADLRVEPGECVSLIGQSGSGKSTFLHLLGGLEPPDRGEVRVDEVALARLSDSERDRFRNQKLAFIFQFHHLLQDHSALDNVAMPGLIARWSRAAARARAAELLTQVGLQGRATHRPGELSGGEQQRVAIARALMMTPGLILADEPTGNLDPATASEVMDVLLSLNQKQGTTLIVVTHSLELASRFPRCLRLKGGQFVEEARC